MKRDITVNLGNLVLSLSDALDLASPTLVRHQQRTAFIVWELAKAANLSNEAIERCFMAALLHDIGALSLEEKIALHHNETENFESHCLCGELILEKVPWLTDIAWIIRFHHKAWKSWADEARDTSLALEPQLIHIADYLERLIHRDQYILHQRERIVSKIREHSDSEFSPHIADLLSSISKREEFWLDMVSPRLYSLLLHEGPYKKVEIELPDLTVISELFRHIIDFRSRFTSTHSSGVATAASMLAGMFGLEETEVGLMEVAGNLHDLGKLVIPNSILDKPDKLSKDEMDIMKSHTYHTYAILNTIGGLKQIPGWAAYHHERLDGSGYPFHCRADQLDTGARIMMVADLFTAMAEDRPYRKGMSKKQVVKIIGQFADRTLIDPKIAELLFDNYDTIHSHVAEKQRLAREFYEAQCPSFTAKG